METLDSTSPSRRGGKLPLVIVAGLVVVALVALAVVLIPRLRGAPAGAVNATAAAMPVDTQIYFSFNPHFDQLPNGDIVSKAWSDPELRKSIEDGIRDALADNDLDWDQDIAPWLGDEVGLGIGNYSLYFTATDVSLPYFVLVAATRDTARLDALLAKLRETSEANGSKYTEQAYREVTTVERKAGPDVETSIAYATVKDLLIVASGRDRLHAAIDALLDGGGFDKSSNYQVAVAKLRGGRAVTAYIDVGRLYGPLLDQLLAEQPLAENLSELHKLRIGMGMSFEANGVLVEFVTLGDPTVGLPVEEKTGLKAAPNPNRLLRAVPDSAFLYMSGRRVSDWFDDTLSLMESFPPDPGVTGIVESLSDFEREAGIDLRKDIFSWMTGEAAAVVMPGGGLIGSSPFPFGLALLVEAGDKQLAEAGPHKLFQALAAQSGTEIVDVTIEGNRMRGLVDALSGDPLVVYGLIGDNFVLALPESAAQKIAAAGNRPLADDDTFRAAIAPLPANTIGYVYLKPKPLVDLMSAGLTLSGQECAACVLFEPMRALAFTIEYPPAEPGSVRSALFMLLDVEE